MWDLGPYSQHFIFFITYEWAQQARMLDYTWLEKLARDKHYSFLGLFISCNENGILCIWDLGTYSQHFIFFVTYDWAQQARMLDYTWLEKLARDEHSSFLGPFISFEES
jgi:hypothetical protein